MKPPESAPLRLAAVIESSDDAIITHGLDGTIETWNRAAQRTFGYSAGEAVGKPIGLIVPPELRGGEDGAIERLQAGEMVSHFETFGLTKDGRRIPISLTLSPVIGADGTVEAISRIARDITTQKALEREAFRVQRRRRPRRDVRRHPADDDPGRVSRSYSACT